MAKIIDVLLSTHCAGKIFLLTFKQLECVHSEIIVQLFDKAMSLLWLQGANHNKVLLFVTVAGSYMVKAVKSLKMSHPRMIHVTCMAHKSSMKYIRFYHHMIIFKRILVGIM